MPLDLTFQPAPSSNDAGAAAPAAGSVRPTDRSRSWDATTTHHQEGMREVRELGEVVDHIEIEALRGEFTDAAMMNDHERLGSLFTPDGAVSIPDAAMEAVGPAQIQAMGERRKSMVACFVQNTHPGIIEIEGDTASGRAYIYELFQLTDGSAHVNYAVYHDRYARTPDGWKFAERVFEIRYLDSAPLTGSAPTRVPDADRDADRDA
jgi:ketosteroid isomerase-like protein